MCKKHLSSTFKKGYTDAMEQLLGQEEIQTEWGLWKGRITLLLYPFSQM